MQLSTSYTMSLRPVSCPKPMLTGQRIEKNSVRILARIHSLVSLFSRGLTSKWLNSSHNIFFHVCEACDKPGNLLSLHEYYLSRKLMSARMEAAERNGSQPVLRTDRLILRLADPFNSSDCQEILRTYHSDNPQSVSGIRTASDLHEKFRRHGPRKEFCTLTPPPNGLYFLVYLPSNSVRDSNGPNAPEGAFVGDVMLNFRSEMPYPDLGFALLPQFEGHGYATEAGLAVLKYWRETVGVKEIFAGTAPDNRKSQKLIERLGFIRAGTFDVIFGLPPNDRRQSGGVAFVLPGMKWQDGLTMQLTLGPEAEGPKDYEKLEP